MAEIKEKDEEEKSIKRYVPSDIVEEILHRLPCKSLVRLMSTCKLWYSAATDHKFITSHQRRTVTNPSHLLLLDRRHGKIHLCSLDADSFNHVRSFAPPPLDRRYGHMLPSSYGLTCGLCCHGDEKKMAVFNPITQQIMIITGMPSYYDPDNYWMLGFGFGFHPQTNQYKLVIVLSQSTDEGDIISGHVLTLQPAGLRDSIWRQTTCFQHSPGWISTGFTAVCAEGVLYWKATRSGLSEPVVDFLSFDLQSEEFRWVTGPRISEWVQVCHLMNLQQKLCLVEVFCDRRDDKRKVKWTMNIWMQMNSTRGDWTLLHKLDVKLKSRDLYNSDYILPLCIRNGKMIIVRKSRSRFYTYDLEEKSLRILKGKLPTNDRDQYEVVYAHAETLVSVS